MTMLGNGTSSCEDDDDDDAYQSGSQLIHVKMENQQRSSLEPGPAVMSLTWRSRSWVSCTHPAPVQLVQPAVDPLLHVQPPLQLFAVVLDGDPGLAPLRVLTRRLLPAAHLVHPPAHPLSRHPDYPQQFKTLNILVLKQQNVKEPKKQS